MKFIFLIILILPKLVFSEVAVPKMFKSAEFTQQRYLKATDIKLESMGTVFANDDQELVWSQKTPFAFETIISKDKMYNVENGKRVAVDNPIVLQMSKMLNELFRGDLTSLKDKFKINYSNKSKELELIPVDKLIAKAIERIVVKVDVFVVEFQLFEKTGNFLKIEFSKHKELIQK